MLIGGRPLKIRQEWAEFTACVQEGDELWLFNSPPQTWAIMAGRAGVAIVRSGELVKTFTTRMN